MPDSLTACAVKTQELRNPVGGSGFPGVFGASQCTGSSHKPGSSQETLTRGPDGIGGAKGPGCLGQGRAGDECEYETGGGRAGLCGRVRAGGCEGTKSGEGIHLFERLSAIKGYRIVILPWIDPRLDSRNHSSYLDLPHGAFVWHKQRNLGGVSASLNRRSTRS
jgi:hypothetical protein